MKARGNILLQYTLATVAIVIAVTIALGVTLTRRIAAYQIRSHITVYQEIVRLAVKDDADVYRLFAADSPGSLTSHTAELFQGFLSVGNVFRVKVWGRDAAILWSDQKELIGQKFLDNEGFQDAMTGAVSYENAELEKAENIDEKNKGVTLEIYTPVFRGPTVGMSPGATAGMSPGPTVGMSPGATAGMSPGATVVGVIELYEADHDLFSQIERNTLFTWALVVIAGMLLWLLLFFIFLRAYRRQRRTNTELVETQDVTIFALAYQAELRDRETGKHLERTARYVRTFAEELSRRPLYRSYLTPGYISDLVKSAPLHDIGKVGISDSILLKPGKLSQDEMAEMKKHCEYGARVLLIAEKKLEFQSFLAIAIQLTLYHHEKWDGTGYPHGLAGDAIPVSGRIMALADNYDALRSERVYKPSFPHEECRSIIVGLSGKHFDPELVEVFLKRQDEFAQISEELAD